jgi:hypothetical protein
MRKLLVVHRLLEAESASPGEPRRDPMKRL